MRKWDKSLAVMIGNLLIHGQAVTVKKSQIVMITFGHTNGEKLTLGL